ncbi:phytanoyl-CoA dioxygenase family protein [bacterium]|nr:phytanoyl-CoA dioxygenase family protein [bacterium]
MEHLLTDLDVVNFIVTGYHIVEPDLPDGLNETIAARLDTLDSNPGDAITETVPELWQVLDHPQVRGVLTSLLGIDYEVQPHRHWHCKQPNSEHMNWHQDSTNSRDIRLNRFLGLYYPTNITPDMGPTMIVPGTQYRNAPTDRMATYTNIRGQIPLTVKAGTIAFTHYDLWHGTAANRSDRKRHMLKFLFRRTRENDSPTWNHDPDCMNQPRDWNKRDKSEDPGNTLAFGNPLKVSQSDHYKERRIRRQVWDYLRGGKDSIKS